MSESLRLTLQLISNVLGVGFVIIIGASQFGEFLADHRLRHIAAALAWWILVPILVLRTAGTVKPPLLDPQLIMDGMIIGWIICLFFGMIWGILRLFDRKKEAAARERLGLDK